MRRSHFVTHSEAAARVTGKTVALVGSAPSVLRNPPGLVDSRDVVVRVNNYRLSDAAGRRTDIYYSYFGGAIRKTARELTADGVELCWCKCPDSKPIQSLWHERNRKQLGIDFRYIYKMREDWWFCDTYVPSDEEFLRSFELLGKHVPTTGFQALLDILRCEPKSVYMTGFDFFRSGIHNVNETWKPGDPNDPIGHRPQLELEWVVNNVLKYPIQLDLHLSDMVRGVAA